MKKIDDKKIKGISIQFDMSTKLNELDGAILDFEKNTDHKHEIDVSVDITFTVIVWFIFFSLNQSKGSGIVCLKPTLI